MTPCRNGTTETKWDGDVTYVTINDSDDLPQTAAANSRPRILTTTQILRPGDLLSFVGEIVRLLGIVC